MDIEVKRQLGLTYTADDTAHPFNDPTKQQRRKQRRVTRSNYGDWKKAKRSWVDWLVHFGRRRRKGEGNVIPVKFRPDVPYNAKLLKSGNVEALESYWAALKAVTTKKQFAHIRGLYA